MMTTTGRELRESRAWPHTIVLDDDFVADDVPQPALLKDVAVAIVIAAMLGTLVMWLL